MKKLPSSSLAALAVMLLAGPAALAMDQRQADAACVDWKLECPKGATIGDGLPKKTGALECKLKGGAAKEGPAVNCKDRKALSWGDWKAGKKHGLQVTLRPNGSWTEELFAQGKPEGRSVEYSADGQLLKETFFHEGKKHGPERTFQTDGKQASEEFWDKGAKSKKPVAAFATGESKAKAAAKAKGSKSTAAPEGEEESSTDEAQTPAAESKPEEPEAPASGEAEPPAAKEGAQAESTQE
ncbi:toxin-antitoxin system YwqK family antitoxin [Hyalangium versicolor]|uniref:toxin-antitoxin system YwqK family antitoxin n=1 Tax=Hyalangium versicolor TaxID=2861190 RepID=UPI001CCABA4C|nr:hypothetical protein [Hyalangium versicolor]